MEEALDEQAMRKDQKSPDDSAGRRPLEAAGKQKPGRVLFAHSLTMKIDSCSQHMYFVS